MFYLRAVYFNAYSSFSLDCYDCVVTYEGEYADSHESMEPATGTFKCPRSGDYLFQFHGVVEKGHEIQVPINNNKVC